MDALKVSQHAIDQFRAQTTSPDHEGLTDDQIRRRILNWWATGKLQEPHQYHWAHKFKNYGLEDCEHRRIWDWVLTRAQGTIVSVHFKTRTERRRDKRHRRKSR